MKHQSQILEQEKENFLKVLCHFLNSTDVNYKSITGSSKSDAREVIKQLLLMGYHGMSYRRSISDIRILQKNDYFSKALPRTTLNDYMNRKETLDILQRLIQLSALAFRDSEDTVIVDSTWFATRMYIGGHKRVHNKKVINFEETRKVHIACLKNSRAICSAITTNGKIHDSPIFEELLTSSSKLFNIKSVLGDKGYCSRKNYLLCQELGIEDVFVDFKVNMGAKRGKSKLWKERIELWKRYPLTWHEGYRFRVIVEGIFGSIKRKHNNYLRSRNIIAQDNELLMKCLVHNLTLISKEIMLGQASDKRKRSD